MTKQTGNIAKKEEGRRVGGLAHCLSLACLIELMILMILSVNSIQLCNLQKKNSLEKQSYKLFPVQLWVISVVAILEVGI